PLNECYMQGTANGTGPTCVCSNNYFDGRSCDTGDPCELGVCATGTCTVDAPVTCPGDECNFPLGSCNIVTGCANPKPDGTACTAPNGCASQCSAGVCPNPTTCAASELRAFWLFM